MEYIPWWSRGEESQWHSVIHWNPTSEINIVIHSDPTSRINIVIHSTPTSGISIEIHSDPTSWQPFVNDGVFQVISSWIVDHAAHFWCGYLPLHFRWNPWRLFPELPLFSFSFFLHLLVRIGESIAIIGESVDRFKIGGMASWVWGRWWGHFWVGIPIRDVHMVAVVREPVEQTNKAVCGFWVGVDLTLVKVQLFSWLIFGFLLTWKNFS